MTNKELLELANSGEGERKAEKSKDKDNEKSKEIKTPKTVLEISRDYVEEFYKTANAEERLWIKTTIAELTRDFGKVNYFSKFKMFFAERFIPDIITDKQVKPSLLESLFEIDELQEEAVVNE
jgi:hypothetical protein